MNAGTLWRLSCPGGDVLIAGGSTTVELFPHMFVPAEASSAELFDPTDNTFTKLEGAGSELSEVREFATASTLSDGRVLVAGGVNSQSWLSQADVFFSAPEAQVVGGGLTGATGPTGAAGNSARPSPSRSSPADPAIRPG